MLVSSELQQRGEVCIPISCILYLVRTCCYAFVPSSRSQRHLQHIVYYLCSKKAHHFYRLQNFSPLDHQFMSVLGTIS